MNDDEEVSTDDSFRLAVMLAERGLLTEEVMPLFKGVPDVELLFEAGKVDQDILVADLEPELQETLKLRKELGAVDNLGGVSILENPTAILNVTDKDISEINPMEVMVEVVKKNTSCWVAPKGVCNMLGDRPTPSEVAGLREDEDATDYGPCKYLQSWGQCAPKTFVNRNLAETAKVFGDLSLEVKETIKKKQSAVTMLRDFLKRVQENPLKHNIEYVALLDLLAYFQVLVYANAGDAANNDLALIPKGLREEFHVYLKAAGAEISTTAADMSVKNLINNETVAAIVISMHPLLSESSATLCKEASEVRGPGDLPAMCKVIDFDAATMQNIQKNVDASLWSTIVHYVNMLGVGRVAHVIKTLLVFTGLVPSSNCKTNGFSRTWACTKYILTGGGGGFVRMLARVITAAAFLAATAAVGGWVLSSMVGVLGTIAGGAATFAGTVAGTVGGTVTGVLGGLGIGVNAATAFNMGAVAAESLAAGQTLTAPIGMNASMQAMFMKGAAVFQSSMVSHHGVAHMTSAIPAFATSATTAATAATPTWTTHLATMVTEFTTLLTGYGATAMTFVNSPYVLGPLAVIGLIYICIEVYRLITGRPTTTGWAISSIHHLINLILAVWRIIDSILAGVVTNTKNTDRAKINKQLEFKEAILSPLDNDNNALETEAQNVLRYILFDLDNLAAVALNGNAEDLDDVAILEKYNNHAEVLRGKFLQSGVSKKDGACQTFHQAFFTSLSTRVRGVMTKYPMEQKDPKN